MLIKKQYISFGIDFLYNSLYISFLLLNLINENIQEKDIVVIISVVYPFNWSYNTSFPFL